MALTTEDRRLFNRRAEENAKEKLHNMLARSSNTGNIVAVITFEKSKKRINCYGQCLPNEAIFRVLDLNTNHKICRPHWGRFDQRFNEASFVPASVFGQKSDDWIVLIGVKTDPDIAVVKVIN